MNYVQIGSFFQLQTERPNLTPEEIEEQIRMEWDYLSPKKRLKYGKRPSEECDGSPKKKQRIRLPTKTVSFWITVFLPPKS